MLSYETCKRLKEAGFPQDREECAGISIHNCHDSCEDLYCPTLSELIEACDGFHDLTHVKLGENKEWAAVGGTLNLGEGKTPEEAVAALYLSLHEKKDE